MSRQQFRSDSGNEDDPDETENHLNREHHQCHCEAGTNTHCERRHQEASDVADKCSAFVFHVASSGQNHNGHEQNRDDDGVVYGVVHDAPLDTTLEVLIGEPQSSNTQRQRGTERDESDEVNETELDASLHAVTPVASALTEVVFFVARQRRQGEEEYRKEQYRVVLPLEPGEHDVPLSASVTPPEQRREHPQDGVLVHEWDVVAQQQCRRDDEPQHGNRRDELDGSVLLDDLPVLRGLSATECRVGNGESDEGGQNDCPHSFSNPHISA